MNRRLLTTTLAAVALALAARPASAGQATNTLTVSATVLGTCEIEAATLAFGDYDPQLGKDAQADITVNCTNGTGYSIAIAGTNADRRMSGGVGEFLDYDLYSDGARTTAWDAANPVSGTANIIGAGLADYTHVVYGRIPAGQQVTTGGYGDSLTMTVNF